MNPLIAIVRGIFADQFKSITDRPGKQEFPTSVLRAGLSLLGLYLNQREKPLMHSPSQSLTKDEVKDLVYSYDNANLTDGLYQFGSMMLGELQQRSAQIDAKSQSLMAWSTGVLAFLFAFVDQTTDVVASYFVVASALSTLIALAFAFYALRTRDEWASPSDRSWLERRALGDADELKRYYIRVMHDVRARNAVVTERKASCLHQGEILLLIGAVFMFCGVISRLT